MRCVIARSFGEIFWANCFRNRLLPVALEKDVIARLMKAAQEGKAFEVDLEAQTVKAEGVDPVRFDIAPARKRALLMGWNETQQIIEEYGSAIDEFESKQKGRQPWLYEAREQQS